MLMIGPEGDRRGHPVGCAWVMVVVKDRILERPRKTRGAFHRKARMQCSAMIGVAG
jgi:nicotinamide mononucleotide (NMN) deamidase PncC